MKTQFNSPGRPSRLASALSIGAFLFASTAMQAQTVLNFDSDAEGFVQLDDATSMEWVNDAEFGGSLKISSINGYRINSAGLDLFSNPTLRTAIENAASSGGTIKFTVRVRQEDMLGTRPNPNWFEIALVSRATTESIGYFEKVVLTPIGGFPLASTFTAVVEIPITSVIDASTPNNGTFQYLSGATTGELRLGLNSDNNINYGAGGTPYPPDQQFEGGAFYIDDITVIGTPPPAVGLYTFDEDVEGFGGGGESAPPLTHSADYGGTLTVTIQDSEFRWYARKDGLLSNELSKLRDTALRGGFISFDIIGPAGYLNGRGFQVAVQAHNPWDWNEAVSSIPGSSVQSLPDGREIARVHVPSWSFGLGRILVGPNYNMWIGLSGLATPTLLHFDNISFTPFPESGSRLTFDEMSELQNFTAESSAILLASNQDDLFLQNPSGSVFGARAVFSDGDSDEQVQESHAALLEAATKGGVLRLLVKSATLEGRMNGFTGMNVTVAYADGEDLQQQSLFINESAFTEGGDPDSDPAIPNNQTPTAFSRTVIIPLHPAGSNATNGFVIPAGDENTDYTFLIGTGADNVDTVGIVFDDFEIIPNSDPEIIHIPTLPPGSSSIVGRIISNAPNYATFSATGLPPGVTLEPTTGLLSGTPTIDGTYSVTFSVSHAGETDISESIEWVISGAAGVILSPQIVSFTMDGADAVITWTGTGSEPVRVLRSQTLAADGWTEIDTGNTSGTFTDDQAPAGAAFYRIAVP